MSVQIQHLRRSISARTGAGRGMTLIELLAVMAILATMMGLSAAVYWRMSQNMKEQGAAAEIDVALRQARTNAVASNAPAFVELDAENHLVIPWVYKVVGLWHFENKDGFGRTPGAHSSAILRSSDLKDDGKIGKCAYLPPGSCIDLGVNPDFDCDDGGYIEAYVRPFGINDGGTGYIFYKQDSYYLTIKMDGTLQGNAGGKNVDASDYHLAAGRWTKVALAWDRHSTRIFVDDAAEAIGPGSVPQVNDHPLLVGHEDGGFVGRVDEVRVMSASKGRQVFLPGTSTLKHTTQPWDAVYFANDGTLDIRHHAGPVSITLLQGTTVRTVTVSMLGLTSREEVQNKEQYTQDEQAKNPDQAKGP